MKKLLSVAILASIFGSHLVADELTGDTRLACEAILCLSSSEKPSECQPSLDRYFSINAKKWKDTVTKRRNFLQLCPVGDIGEADMEFRKLRDEILANVSDPCDLKTLNSKIETKRTQESCGDCERGWTRGIAIRISKKLPQSCQLLGSSKYTNIKPRNVCSDEFYSSFEWYKGETADGKKINKDCWVFE